MHCLIFGAGFICRQHYLAVLAQLCDFIIVVDPEFKNLDFISEIQEILGDHVSYRLISDVRDFKIPDTIDHAFILTNHKSHYPLAKYCIDKRIKHIFIEKPAVLEAYNWNELLKNSNNLGVKLWPGYHHHNTTLNELSGMLDEPLLAHDIERIDIFFTRGRIPQRSWGKSFTSKSLSSGGCGVDLGPHVMSIISSIVPDIANYTLEVRECSFSNSCNESISEVDTGLKFTGTYRIPNIQISATISYDLLNNNKPRKIHFKQKNRLKEDVVWIESSLFKGNRQITLSPDRTDLAFRKMIYDFLDGKDCQYQKLVMWNIECIEKLYASCGIKISDNIRVK